MNPAQHIISALNSRLEDMDTSLPLIRYALDENILPTHEYLSLEETDLMDKHICCAGDAKALMVLWIRRYYERSDGSELYTILKPKSNERTDSAGRARWLKMLGKAPLPSPHSRMQPGGRHVLCPPEGAQLDAWMRGQCWVLKGEEGKGGTSLSWKNNTAVYNAIDFEQLPETFDELLALDEKLEAQVSKLDNQYLRWIWEDEVRRSFYILTLQALADDVSPEHTGEWWECLRGLGNSLACRSRRVLYINNRMCHVRLALDIKSQAELEAWEKTLDERHIRFINQHYINADELDCAEEEWEVSIRHRSVKLPSIPAETPLVFQMRSNKKLHCDIFTEWKGKFMLHTKKLWVTHTGRGRVSFILESRDGSRRSLEPEECISITDPFRGRYQGYEASLIDFSSLTDEVVIGSQFRILSDGVTVFTKTILFNPNIEYGDELIADMHEENSKPSSRPLFYIHAGDRVEICNPERITLQENEFLDIDTSNGRTCLCLRDAANREKEIELRYTAQGDSQVRRHRLCFMRPAWEEELRNISSRRSLDVEAIFVGHKGQTPRRRLRYTTQGGELKTYILGLTSPVFYWHGPNGDRIETKSEFADMKTWRVKCLLPKDWVEEPLLHVTAGEKHSLLSAHDVRHIEEGLQQAGVTPGETIRIFHRAAADYPQQLFNGVFHPLFPFLSPALHLHIPADTESHMMTLRLEHEQHCRLCTESEAACLSPRHLELRTDTPGCHDIRPELCRLLQGWPAGYVLLSGGVLRHTLKWNGNDVTDAPLPSLAERWAARLGEYPAALLLYAGLEHFCPEVGSDIRELQATMAQEADAMPLAVMLDFFHHILPAADTEQLRCMGSRGYGATLNTALELQHTQDLKRGAPVLFDFCGILSLWQNGKKKPVHGVYHHRYQSAYLYKGKQDRNTSSTAALITPEHHAGIASALSARNLILKPQNGAAAVQQAARDIADQLAPANMPVNHIPMPDALSIRDLLAPIFRAMPDVGDYDESMLDEAPIPCACGAATIFAAVLRELPLQQKLLLALAIICHACLHPAQCHEQPALHHSAALKPAMELAKQSPGAFCKLCRVATAIFTYFAVKPSH